MGQTTAKEKTDTASLSSALLNCDILCYAMICHITASRVHQLCPCNPRRYEKQRTRVDQLAMLTSTIPTHPTMVTVVKRSGKAYSCLTTRPRATRLLWPANCLIDPYRIVPLKANSLAHHILAPNKLWCNSQPSYAGYGIPQQTAMPEANNGNRAKTQHDIRMETPALNSFFHLTVTKLVTQYCTVSEPHVS